MSVMSFFKVNVCILSVLTRRCAANSGIRDRTMWGSDQSSSVEIPGLIKLVKGCQDVVDATAYQPGERILFPGELSKKESLRPTK